MDLETFLYSDSIWNGSCMPPTGVSWKCRQDSFELRMYELDKAGEGKNHGLDLMVYSAVTGESTGSAYFIRWRILYGGTVSGTWNGRSDPGEFCSDPSGCDVYR